MKLTLASRSQHLVRSYTEHSVQVGEQQLSAPSLVCAEQVLPWPMSDMTQLTKNDLPLIFEQQPEVVILSTGARQHFPAPAIQAAFLARGIGFEVMTVGAACRTFNVLLSEDRRAVLALWWPPQ